MDTVNQLMASSGGSSSSTTAEAAMPANKGLEGMEMAGSAIAAVSKFGLAMSKATALSTEADREKLQGRQELLQAQETAHTIQQAYISVIGAQQGVAAAGNVDIASGSVVEAGRQAQLTADRATRVTRNTADMNAALRRARAAALKQQAGGQRIMGFVNLGLDIGKMAVQAGG